MGGSNSVDYRPNTACCGARGAYLAHRQDTENACGAMPCAYHRFLCTKRFNWADRGRALSTLFALTPVCTTVLPSMGAVPGLHGLPLACMEYRSVGHCSVDRVNILRHAVVREAHI